MNATALVAEGLRYHEAGRPDQAEPLYHRALAAEPEHADAWFYLGTAQLGLGRAAEGAESLRRSLLLRPGHALAHNNLGTALVHQGRLDDACTSFREAVRQRPDYVDGLCNLGAVLSKLRRHEEALPVLRRALELRPGHAESHNNLGSALDSLGRPEEAAACFRAALRLQPDLVQALCNLGTALNDLGQLAEAEVALGRALQLHPRHGESHQNLGVVHWNQGRHAEALACYREALRHDPNLPDAQLNLSFSMLRAGDYENGLRAYEWRLKCPKRAPRALPTPVWDGGPLHGRPLVLHAEQGFGDTLQMARYAPRLKERGASEVVFVCQPGMAGLLARTPGLDRLLGPGDPFPAGAVHAMLLSLPYLLGTRVETVPAAVPYVFADPTRIETWRGRLAEKPGFKIGIAWQGNRKYSDDRHRSFPLCHFAALARVPGVVLYSLQKGYGTEQLAQVAGSFAVVDLGSRLDETTGPFEETAAVIRCLDLVVTCDSVLGHLAGALGVPVWVALTLAPDWRWLNGRVDSPWYPSHRLFRQEKSGDWDGVFDRMAVALAERLGAAPVSLTAADWLARGLARQRVGDVAGAAACYRSCVEADAGHGEAWSRFGAVLLAQGREEEAVTALDTARRLRPGDHEVVGNLGTAHARLGHFDTALAHYGEALRLCPNYVDAWSNIGLVLARLGRVDEAVAAYRRVLAGRPDHPETHNNLGAVLLRRGDVAGAVACFAEAARLRPEYAEAHHNLGVAQMRRGLPTDAVAHFQEALRLRPTYAEARRNLEAAQTACGAGRTS